MLLCCSDEVLCADLVFKIRSGWNNCLKYWHQSVFGIHNMWTHTYAQYSFFSDHCSRKYITASEALSICDWNLIRSWIFRSSFIFIFSQPYSRAMFIYTVFNNLFAYLSRHQYTATQHGALWLCDVIDDLLDFILYFNSQVYAEHLLFKKE